MVLAIRVLGLVVAAGMAWMAGRMGPTGAEIGRLGRSERSGDQNGVGMEQLESTNTIMGYGMWGAHPRYPL